MRPDQGNSRHEKHRATVHNGGEYVTDKGMPLTSPFSEAVSKSKPSTILNVDDTEAQRYAVSRILRHAGFEVLEAGSGKQALDLMVNSPDLVILDVNLPDVGGYAVCRQIKSNDSTARTPVLHLSASMVSTEARVRGLDGGADAYLVQPVEPEELLATVRALLRVKKSEEALWTSEQQYRLFFEANPLACWVFDAADFTILAVNEAAARQYEYTRDEFTKLRVGDIVAGDSAQELVAGPGTGTRKHQTKSGRLLDVEEVYDPLKLGGRDVRLAIVQDVSARLIREEAQRQEQMQRLLLERVLQAQEAERQRIARELHDETGQLMTSLLVGLRTIADAKQLKQAKTQAKALRKITSQAIGEVGRLARGLHSSVLAELGMQEAVQRFASEYATMHDVKVEVEFRDIPFSQLSKEAEIGLYRIVQEALTNVARHSQASAVSVRFEWRDPMVRLMIQDNGRGFRSTEMKERPSSHLGIEGMRQRAIMLGGKLEIRSQPNKGTLVEVEVSVAREATEIGSAD